MLENTESQNLPHKINALFYRFSQNLDRIKLYSFHQLVYVIYIYIQTSFLIERVTP